MVTEKFNTTSTLPLDEVIGQINEENETVSDISETIGYYVTACEDLNLAGQYIATLKNITLDEVKNTAQTYLNKNNACVSVLMPKN